MLEGLKAFIKGENYDDGFSDDDFEEYEDGYEEVDYYASPTPTPTYKFTKSEDEKIIKMSSSNSQQVSMKIMSVKTSEDTILVVKHIKENKACVLKIGESADRTQQNNIDFISGAVYALSGSVQVLNEEMVIAAPKSFDLQGDFFEDVKSQSGGLFKMMNKK